MDSSAIEARMQELFKPIDEAILNCDSREEILMIASAMLISSKNIYDSQIGKEGRIKCFLEC